MMVEVAHLAKKFLTLHETRSFMALSTYTTIAF